MQEEKLKIAKGLLGKIPSLDKLEELRWEEKGAGKEFENLCVLLQENTISLTSLWLGSDNNKKSC